MVIESALRYFLEVPGSSAPAMKASALFDESSFLNDLSYDFQVAA